MCIEPFPLEAYHWSKSLSAAWVRPHQRERECVTRDWVPSTNLIVVRVQSTIMYHTTVQKIVCPSSSLVVRSLTGWSFLLTGWSFLLTGWSFLLTGWSFLLTGWSFLLTGWSFLLTRFVYRTILCVTERFLCYRTNESASRFEGIIR
jgi:hypothetical protein